MNAQMTIKHISISLVQLGNKINGNYFWSFHRRPFRRRVWRPQHGIPLHLLNKKNIWIYASNFSQKTFFESLNLRLSTWYATLCKPVSAAKRATISRFISFSFGDYTRYQLFSDEENVSSELKDEASNSAIWTCNWLGRWPIDWVNLIYAVLELADLANGW